MANSFFTQGLTDLQEGDIDLLVDTINVALVAATYTFDAAHDFYNDISASVVGTPVALGTKTVTGGVFDAADSTFTTVSGAQVGGIAVYKNTGVAATSPLIYFFDTGTGLPFTPNGGNITVAWDNSIPGIWKLANS